MYTTTPNRVYLNETDPENFKKKCTNYKIKSTTCSPLEISIKMTFKFSEHFRQKFSPQDNWCCRA